jgi:MATE family multidrug resistance protein
MSSWLSSSQSWISGLSRKPNKRGSHTVPNERTALVPSPQPDNLFAESHEAGPGHGTKYQIVLQEFWILFRGSIPVVLAYALQNSLQTISVLIVGRLSPEALATAAFSYMFAMATGWLIALGGTTAIDTLASASFTGSKNPHDLGIILQRSFVVLSLFYLPVAILWFCSEPLFKVLGQEDYIARDSARFLSVLAPGGLGYIYFEAMKKYLQAQGQSPRSLRLI